MQAYYHEFKKVVEAADVIIEVLDARDPMGCRCPDVENTIATKYPATLQNLMNVSNSHLQTQIPKQEDHFTT